MYPDVPYDGISWPMMQHAGVLSKEVMDGLLHACMLCNGQVVDAERINNYLIQNEILTPNVRSDSQQVDAWRDYQQILSEFGLIYSTRLSKEIRLTPVAMAYLSGRVDYEEMITLQIMRYQYPNGHKSQLSPSLKDSYGRDFTFSSFTEMQEANNILLRPAVLVWQVMDLLWKQDEKPYLSLDELQTYAVRCTRNSDLSECVRYILRSRREDYSLSPMPRARRNMSDWMKVLNQTPLFKTNYDGSLISLSSFSIKRRDQIYGICKQMSDPLTFWHYQEEDFKRSWFDFYGSFDEVTDWVLNK